MRDNVQYDCAQVLVLPGKSDALNVEKAVQIIRTKQFWHVVVSGCDAADCARALRKHSGMPNFLTEEAGSALRVRDLLERKGICPRTLAVIEEDRAAYAEAFPETKIFEVIVQ